MANNILATHKKFTRKVKRKRIDTQVFLIIEKNMKKVIVKK